MTFSKIPLWKESPFIRILLPFIAGILIQRYVSYYNLINQAIIFTSFTGILIFSQYKLKHQFRHAWMYGALIHLLLIGCGGTVSYYNDPYKARRTIKNCIRERSFFIASISDPLSEKPASWKAVASVTAIQNKKGTIFPQTNILLYFRKDNLAKVPKLGDRIAFIKTPQKIKNFTGLGTFDYEQFCALKNIHVQVFLSSNEFITLAGSDADHLSSLLLSARNWVIGILKKYIPGNTECGLAQALLIGYKDDLDKDLLQSYSNTGVVHVIAISGLHLGLIYSLLKMLCSPLKKKSILCWLSPVIIIIGLWLFSLLAGGSPSVLRSAVMFTFIVAGEYFSRRSTVINHLSASALFLLCINPFWLWDLGFILSYSALLSIVLFMKPLYHLFISKNKILDTVWKLNAVTLSAQILTLPVIIYYFRQFPMLFLITNMAVIPLSGIILTGEIILCSIYYFEFIASASGKILAILINLMNRIVKYIDSFPFASIQNIHINFLQVVLLYVFIASASGWLLLKYRRGLPFALITAIIFFIAEAVKLWE